MNTESAKQQGEEKVRTTTNVVGENKKEIMDEPENKSDKICQPVSDTEVKKAVERINPDPNSLKSRG